MKALLCRRALTLGYAAILFMSIASACMAQNDPRALPCGDMRRIWLAPWVRLYFGLEPDEEKGMVKIELAKTDTGFAIVQSIAYMNNQATSKSYPLSAAAVDALCTYVYSYEKLFESDSVEIDWTLLRGLVHPRKRHIDDPIHLTVTTMSGSSYSGVLTFINREGLAIVPDSLPIDWLQLDKRVVIIHPYDVKEIEDRDGFLKHFVREVDLPVYGVPDVYERHVVPALAPLALFPQIPSPEVAGMLQYMIEKYSSYYRPGTSSEAMDALRPERFHIIAAYGSGPMVGKGTASVTPFGKRAEEHDLAIGGSMSLTVGGAVNILDWLRVAGRFSLLPAPDAAEGVKDYDRVEGSAIEGLLEFVPLRRSPVLTGAAARLEMTVGAGVAQRTADITSRIGSPYSTTYFLTSTEKRKVTGPLLTIGGNYYIRRNLSLGVAWSYAMLPAVTMERRELPSLDNTGFVLKTIEQHEIPLAMSDLSIELRLHF